MSEQDPEEKTGRGSLVLEKKKLKRPSNWAVLLHNDDYTTMEFVIMVLKMFFHKEETEATQIMLNVHESGHGVAGLFSKDVAETKVYQVAQFAEKQGHPLKCTIEKQ
jgi:ATP-dependent Clp protease adaptor protein ClpS